MKSLPGHLFTKITFQVPSEVVSEVIAYVLRLPDSSVVSESAPRPLTNIGSTFRSCLRRLRISPLQRSLNKTSRRG